VSNIKIGSKFEREFCKMLSESGFWVHRITPNASGQQPADVIAIKDGYHALIDCKVVSNEKQGFSFQRVEDNQRSSMELFKARGGEVGWFAIRLLSGEVRMLHYNQLMVCEEQGMKRLTIDDLQMSLFTWSFEQWVRRAEQWR